MKNRTLLRMLIPLILIFAANALIAAQEAPASSATIPLPRTASLYKPAALKRPIGQETKTSPKEDAAKYPVQEPKNSSAATQITKRAKKHEKSEAPSKKTGKSALKSGELPKLESASTTASAQAENSTKPFKPEEPAILTTTPESEKVVKPVPVMGENDSIPFMKKTAANPQAQSASGSIWLKTIGSVLLILGLLLVGTWVFKKSGLAAIAGRRSEDSPELRILSSVSPRNGQTISVVRFGERILLVGSTAQSFTLLADDGSEGGSFDENSSIVPFEFEGKPVSVSELLARDEAEFEEELKKADGRLKLGLGGHA